MSACDQRFDLWTKMPASYDDAKKAGPRPETTSKPEDDEDDENSTLERKIDHLNDAVRARHFLIRVPRPARTLSLCLSNPSRKILQDGGVMGGWHEQEHEVFLRIWTQVHNSPPWARCNMRHRDECWWRAT